MTLEDFVSMTLEDSRSMTLKDSLLYDPGGLSPIFLEDSLWRPHPAHRPHIPSCPAAAATSAVPRSSLTSGLGAKMATPMHRLIARRQA